MKSALIFLNGYYDARHLDFYRHEIEAGVAQGSPLICADGGLRLFHQFGENTHAKRLYRPDVLIGDLDSVADLETKIAKNIVQEWVGQTDKEWTDGQLAVLYALEHYGCRHIIIYGGLPQPGAYETDQFLGNLKLMRFGHYQVEMARLKTAPTGGKRFGHYQVEMACFQSASPDGKGYQAEMRDARQTIHYVVSELRLTRKNSGVQRVSLIAEERNVIVAESQHLRWELDSLNIDADLTNALRNEFVAEASWASIRLAEESAPVYVIHNWYD